MSSDDKSGKPENALDFFVTNLADSLDPSASSGSLLWEPQSGPQTMAYESLADETFYGGAAGGGKANACSSLVSTPNGWVKMGDIKVGDYVNTVTGHPTRVIGVYPQGIQSIYEVTFIDGAKTYVTKDHLWNYWIAGKQWKQKNIDVLVFDQNDDFVGIKNRPIPRQLYGIKVGTTEILMDYLDKAKKRESQGKRPYWPIIPVTDPIVYNDNRTSEDLRNWIDPYVLGVLLGDGCISGGWIHDVSFASIDREVIDRVESVYRDMYGCPIKDISYVIENESLVDSLYYFNLYGTKSNSKFIPEQYLLAPIEQRLNIAKGLFDTDGYIDERGHVEYTTVSEQLAKDVQHLVRSLGFKATLSSKVGSYRHPDTGNVIECQTAYRIYIRGRNCEQLFHLSRKVDRAKSFNGGNSEVGRRLVDIELVREEEAKCIKVDHPLSLYITDDFIVTHNSDLLLGWATTRAYKSIIYRREYSQMSQLIDRSKEILNDTSANYNANTYTWNNIPGGRMLRFASVPHADSVMKYQGRPHDFIGFDEVTNFLYSQYIFLLAWNRSENPNARTRVIGAGNPPTNVEGEWVIRRWAPWLDQQYGNPAEPGEVRWFVTLDDKEEEVEDDTPIKYKDEMFYPTSRTYIPATLDDNKYYGAEYRARLQSMPVELRSKFLYGDFGIVFKDDPFQVVPSDFVKIGQDRWYEMHKSGQLDEIVNVNPAYGLDPSEAGDDRTMLAHITVNAIQWVKGTDHTDLMDISNWVVGMMGAHKYAPVGVDAIGVGAGVYYRLRQLNYKASGLKVSSRTNMRDRTGNMQFLNLRAYLWWLIRDALDPHGTIQLAIPSDVELERELLAPRWRMTETGLVQVDKNIVIRERLGRSPDKASALMMCLYVSHVRRPQLRIV